MKAQIDALRSHHERAEIVKLLSSSSFSRKQQLGSMVDPGREQFGREKLGRRNSGREQVGRDQSGRNHPGRGKSGRK